ncbi:uncharacterized protein LOC113295647 [Papaver somniferum]|uniref:uncharacterized protein LOC113295647 n=1 Tax=Papaver somniferum TaxID=3469 RepID=UPI000E6F8B77|nr:uncharacterized protein LOC113295647 [Papaver somniferum]
MVAQTCKELQETNNRQQHEIDTLHSKNDASGSNTGGFHTGGRDSNQFHRMPKLDFPRFDGDNPKSWIRKCEYYFQMHNTHELHKTRMAAIHLDGKSTKWYDNFCLNKADIPWKYFCDNVCARFENPAQDNGLSNKLSQLTIVDAYFEEFEYNKALLLGVHHDFPESYFIVSFIGGLKEELRNSVLMFDPKTQLHAFSLTRMQERTIIMQHKSSKPTPKFFSPSNSSTKSYSPATTSQKSPFIPPTGTTSNPPTKPIQNLPFKRLTPEQVQARKAQGLCFNCDEAHKRGHVCKQQYFCVLIGEEDEEMYDTGGETTHETDEDPPLESDMEIPLHALTGNLSGDTIRIPGFIKKKAISILIDTGNTDSFIDSSLAASLQCSITQTGNLLVRVSNCDKTVSSGVCSQLDWIMQGHKFCGDLRLLPLGGCDIVLGADWLRNLGDVLFNLSKLCISFKHKGNKITLTGIQHKTSLSMMSGSALKKFFRNIVMEFTPPPIANLLTEFSDVFTDKTTLPPQRNLDHQIPLKPNSEPVNLRPYRCPYIQKSIVENLVTEMLHSGIIQPSHSSFASPILLVKKKDNTWIFCVDYKKLNNITIKDKFPIPIIDEMLDELHGSKFFTKIEL